MPPAPTVRSLLYRPPSLCYFPPMPYEVTATRKRPRNFEEFYGQDFVSATLVSSLESGRIAHAYLFSGPRGCGKTSAARILAKSLNCEKGPSARPCGTCRSCVEIARGASLDVIEIDGASNTSVDNVRQIKDEVLFPPNGGRYKVYIIDEVHMLSNSAFNALLKTIEEPPPYIVFIFATTELHKVPATIKSRCQQFAFRLFKVDLIRTLLARAASELGVEAEDEALLWIAKEARGSLRDAYTLFDQVVSFADGGITSALIRDKLGLTGLDALGGLFRAFAAGDAAAALGALDAILERGISAEQLASEAADYCRSLLLLKNGVGKADLIGAPASAFDASALEAMPVESIERALALLLALYRDLRYTVDQRFELELAAVRLCRLADYVSPVELARAVGALKRFAAGEGAIAAAGAAAGALPAARPAAAAIADEKKKPLAAIEARLPPRLSEAFDGLAAAAAAQAGGSGTESVDAEERARAAAASSPARRPGGATLRDPGAEDSAGDDADATAAVGDALEDAGGAGADPLRASVIDALGRSSPLLKTGLASSLPWRIEGDKLVIPFRSGMEESVVRGSVADIAAKASEVSGRTLKVALVVETASRKRRAADAPAEEGSGESPDGSPDPAAVVERVFRGARVVPRSEPKA
jgi:DNA polymerase III subunit gamma/tau